MKELCFVAFLIALATIVGRSFARIGHVADRDSERQTGEHNGR